MARKSAKNTPTEATPPQVICTVCEKPIGDRQPRCADGKDGVMHIHHRATSSTAPVTAKSNRPCKWCVNEGVAEPSRVTYFVVGTRKDDKRTQVMVNTYLCQPHIEGISWHSGPRFVGRSPEPKPADQPKKPRSRKATATAAS